MSINTSGLDRKRDEIRRRMRNVPDKPNKPKSKQAKIGGRKKAVSRARQ